MSFENRRLGPLEALPLVTQNTSLTASPRDSETDSRIVMAEQSSRDVVTQTQSVDLVSIDVSGLPSTELPAGAELKQTLPTIQDSSATIHSTPDEASHQPQEATTSQVQGKERDDITSSLVNIRPQIQNDAETDTN
jgi:hypothetical protein